VHLQLGGDLADGLAGLGQLPHLGCDLVALDPELFVMAGGANERDLKEKKGTDLFHRAESLFLAGL